ncbi:SPOR domain-containing protein, partial [Achromobacter sp. GbtcB20]|uniref:SPOR domain-containing protein n=1 Tax=Achromobacter sp. GbtcB20 TaxID=2824765 RepID=UPI00352FFD2E
MIVDSRLEISLDARILQGEPCWIVAALADGEAAEDKAARLRAAGVSAHTRKSGELIRVQVGPFGSREGAEKARAKL